MLEKEYGGFLPIELNTNDDYFREYDKSVCKLNSGRNAILASLVNENCRNVYIPYFNCEYVKETLEKNGIRCCLYYLDKNMYPKINTIPIDSYILIVNYFGLFKTEQLIYLKDKFKRVIFDNTQAFFQKPLMGKRVYNVYSCRKFIGVPDGSYVIHKGGIKKKYVYDNTDEQFIYLIRSIAFGTNANYTDYLKSEEDISKKPIMSMSPITEAILKNADYEKIRKIRRRNFNIYNKALGKINKSKISLSLSSVPMVYPLYLENIDIRKKLIEEHIYIPQWWKYLLDIVDKDSIEFKYSKYLLPLPVDQRYSEKDITNISKTVLKWYRKEIKHCID